MLELVGFQTMVILDPNGMTFGAVGVVGLDFWLLFKSGSSYYDIGVSDLETCSRNIQEKVVKIQFFILF